MNEPLHDAGYPPITDDKIDGWERLLLPTPLTPPKSGDLYELFGNITPCTKRDKGKFYTPYYPQTRVTSLPLIDEALAEVVIVRLLAENWNSPAWIELGGDPKNMNFGGDIGWGQWMRGGLEYQPVGDGKVSRVYAAYFFNQSDTRQRLTAINLLFRYR